MYGGEEFNKISDTRVKVGTVSEGGLPRVKEPIEGMTYDFELDTT
jgi:hypothetical protein